MLKIYLAFLQKIIVSLCCICLTFVAIAQPTISTISPTSGPVGTTVTITGTGFIATQYGNLVNFGTVRATVSAATTTSISVTVPAGAGFGTISVANNLYTAYAPQAFLVTFPGGAGPFNPNSFAPKLDLATTSNPYSVSTGDIDRDGKPDLVLVNTASNTISVFLNTSTAGNLSFAPKLDFATGNSPHRACVADVNGDGVPDIVVTNYADNTVSVFNNASSPGRLSLSSKMDFPTATSPESIVVGDVDGDGETDLVITTGGTTTITILRNSSGTPTLIRFTDISNLAYGGSPTGIALGDIDGDGKSDIVATNTATNNITVLRNLCSPGNVNFGAPSNFFSWNSTQSISIADVDGDGKPELVSGGNQTIAISRNLSSPGNISFATSVAFPNTSDIYTAVADLDGDGKPDIAGANQFSNAVLVTRNLSTPGTLIFDTPPNYYPTGNSPTSIAIADFDGDGKPDLAVSNIAGSSVSVLRNRTNEPYISSFTPVGSCPSAGSQVLISGYKFTGTTSVTIGGAAVPFGLVSDSVISMLVQGPVTGNITVSNAYGTGIFTVPAPVISSFSPSTASPGMTVTITGKYLCNATAVRFGGTPASTFTVNADSSITAIVGTGTNGSLSISGANGTSALSGFTFIPLPVISSFSPHSGPVGAKVTIKGKYFSNIAANDIVYFGAVQAKVISVSDTLILVSVPAGTSHEPLSLTNTDHNLTAWAAGAFTTSFGSGGGIDSASFSIRPAAAVTGTFPLGLASEDLDLDGRPDLVSADFTAGTASIMINSSTGGLVSFAAKSSLVVGGINSQTRSAHGEDFDGDGKKDIFVVNEMDTNLFFFRNTSEPGRLAFAQALIVQAGYESGPHDLATGDIDGDGRPDVIVPDISRGAISVFRNNGVSAGTISFDAPLFLGVYQQAIPNNTVIADFDGDGKLDIAVTDINNRYLYIFRNLSKPGILSFAPFVAYPSPNGALGAIAGDLDGDGLPDILLETAAGISVLRNQSTPGNLSFAALATLTTSTGSITLGDLDGDGKPDLSLVTQTGLMLFNNTSVKGNISVSQPVGFSMPYGYNGNNITISDLNGDGKPDLAVSSNNSTNVTVFLNTIDSASSPLIVSFAPSLAGYGDTVRIKGNHFTGTSAVSFGGNPSAGFQVVSDSLILAILATGSSGNVSVTNSSGTATLSGFLYAGPKVLSFLPASASIGDTVIIRGKNFTAINSVVFGGSPAASFSVASDSVIYAIIGVGASGSVTIQSAGGIDSLGGFVYIAPLSFPQISGFSPDSGATGTTVIIRGKHFAGTSAVYFGGIAAASFQVITDSSVSAIVGIGRTGAIKIKNAAGTDSLVGFIYISTPQPPVITSFTPDSAGVGQSVTIKGRHLNATISVSFGNVPATGFTVQSDSLITATLSTGASGAVAVTTTSGTDTLGGFIFIAAAPPPPKILSFTPDSAAQGGTVTIKGQHFQGTTAVSFGGVAASDFIVQSDSVITAVLSTGATGLVSVITVSGTNTLGGFIFITTAPSPPKILSFTPDSAAQGGTVTIKGQHFQGTTAVSFGGVAASDFIVQNDSLITAVLSTGATGLVSVANASGTDTMSGFIFILATPLQPKIISFTPDSAANGQSVTIKGLHFAGTSAVNFGGTPAASFIVLTDSTIQATLASGASGFVSITTATGTDSLAGFVYLADTVTAPSVISFAPSTGNTGTVVTILGTHFTGATAVSFGGTEASSFDVISDSVIYATVGAGSSGVVTINTAAGNASMTGFVFTKGLTAYPNPATSYVTANFPVLNLASQITIADISGKILLTVSIQPNVGSATINLYGLKPGVYILSWGNGSSMFRISLLVE